MDEKNKIQAANIVGDREDTAEFNWKRFWINCAVISMLLLIAYSAGWLDSITSWVCNNIWPSIGIVLTIAGWIYQVYQHRIKTKGPNPDPFSNSDLLDVPTERIGYSDRAAYVMAELSELAYHEVMPSNSTLSAGYQALEDKGIDAIQFIRDVSRFQRSEKVSLTAETRDEFTGYLKRAKLEMVGDFFDAGSTQGFVCYRKGSCPFIAVVFRGSEKKIEDWLTNAEYHPTQIGNEGKVHNGFHMACSSVLNTIEEKVKIAASSVSAPFTLFFTGHSLGGALALLCARHFEPISEPELPEHRSVCYTFGAPRVADYQYFSKMKTPVYRVVNSADIIPRLPPGAWAGLFGKSVAYIRGMLPTRKYENFFDAMESISMRFQDFRHHGDLRYLPEVFQADSPDMESLRILSNPHHLDTSFWFWRRIAVSFGQPVKSHSMLIYIRKLAEVAKHRAGH